MQDYKFIFSPKKINFDLLAFGIILFSFLLRLGIILSGQINLYYDEAQYWDWSRNLDWSYYSKGPLIAYFIWFWTKIFGPTELGIRFGACLNLTILQSLIYFGLKTICSQKTHSTSYLPLVALIIATTTPLFLVTGILMTTDNLLVLCYSFALFFLYFYLQTPKNKYLIGILISLILGTLAKYTMLIFIPLSLFVCFKYQKKQTLKLTLTLLLGGTIGLLPILIWNIKYNFVGIKHVLYRGSLAGNKAKEFFRPWHFPEFLASQIGVLTPWYFFLLFKAWFNNNTQIFLKPQEYTFCKTFFWPIWLAFTALSFHTKVEANWPALSYVPALIILAISFLQLNLKWQKIVFTCGAITFILFHSIVFIPMPGKLDVLQRMRGYEQIGHYIKQLKQTQFKNPNKIFIISDSYGITSELSFYVPGQQRAFCVNFGRKQNQYDIWPSPKNKIGWDAIFVTKGIEKNIPPLLKKMFKRVLRPIIFHSTHKNKPGQVVSIIICYEYNGFWPLPKNKTY
ncbi:glycosyltransferase family 39 protein [Desulfonauticus submarinus]